MARRKEQINDDEDSNPPDDMEDEPNFDDPDNYEDDISEQGLQEHVLIENHMVKMLKILNLFISFYQILWEI